MRKLVYRMVPLLLPTVATLQVNALDNGKEITEKNLAATSSKESSPGEAHSLHALRVWSIGPSYVGMRTKPRDPIGCRMGNIEWKNVSWLSRPGRSNCVAVCADGILNPVDEFDYGPIPDLPDITKEQAQALWGPSLKIQKTKSDERTYKLIDRNKQVFFLDVVFQNNRLAKYSVRNSESSFPSWINTMIQKPTLPPMDFLGQSSNLRTGSIRPQEMGYVEGPKDRYICRFGDPWQEVIFLTKNCVAVLTHTKDDIELNPLNASFNYGDIPPLNQLTQKQADILWGTEKDIEDEAMPEKRSYSLMSSDTRQFFWMSCLKTTT